MNHQTEYEARLARVNKAIRMEIPDRVPCIPNVQTFPYLNAGYSMAEIMYDTEKAKTALRKFLMEFEPDLAPTYPTVRAGQGPILEKMGVKIIQWAGEPGCNVDPKSIFQFIEKPYLEDDEYPELLKDMSGWLMKRWLPRCFDGLKAMGKINIESMMGSAILPGMAQFADPEIPAMFNKLHEVGKMTVEYYKEAAAFEKETMEMGFPIQNGAVSIAAFDILSDSLRGTIDTMADLYEQPELVHEAIEHFYPQSVYPSIEKMKTANGQMVFIPLHKGLDGFMGPQQYEEFYWPTLKRMVEELISHGLTPYIYTEGKYDSRLETIADVTPGKCLFHFEDVDMKEAKRIVGKNHCICGGFNSRILKTDPQTVRDEVRKIMDICAVDGGFIFEMADTIDDVPVENVEALYDEVKTYGKY